MFYRYEHYMSISHIALIVNMIQSEVEVPVPELREMERTSSLPLLPHPLWPGVLVPVRVPSMGQLEPFINIKKNY